MKTNSGSPDDGNGSDDAQRIFLAPSRLTTEHRVEFRRLALEAMEIAVSSGQKVVEINLGAVIEIDSSGLGVLILVQKRARERGLRLRLLDVPPAVGSLLDATRLEPLIEIVRSH